MTDEEARLGQADGLRRRVEEEVRAGEAATRGLPSPGETRRLLHELQVHQIELEMQNEELRRTQANLRSSYELLVRSQRMSHIGTWVFDPATRQIEWTEEMFHIFGLDPAAGPPTFNQNISLVHPDDRERFEAAAELALTTATSFEIELRALRRDGTIRHLANLCEVEQNRASATRRLVGTTQDVTEYRLTQEQLQASVTEIRQMLEVSDRSRLALLSLAEDQQAAEAALRESEGKYRRLVETAREGIWAIDDKQITTYANPRLAQMLGYRESEMFGQPMESLLFEQDLDAHRQEMELRRQGRERTYQRRFRRKDGSECWTIVSATRLTTPEGHFAGSFAMLTDITDRKTQEDEIHHERDFSRSLIETAQTIVLVLDQVGRIVIFNPYLEEITGWRLEEVKGKDWFETFLPEQDRPRIRDLFSKAVTGEPTRANVNTIVAKDGRERQVEWYDKVLSDAQGHFAGLLSVGQDITDRKQSEKRVLDYQTRLRSLASRLALTEERERRILAERLHDDVSQYLVFCKMKIEMIQKDTENPSLGAGLNQVCDMLTQLLANTRAMTFEMYSPVLKVLGFEAALSAWLRDEIEQRHGIRTEFLDDQQPKPLDEDVKILLFRSVRELLANAVKHAHARLIRVAISRQQDTLCICVEDDGLGFVPGQTMSATAAGFGLFSIHERLADLDGSLDLDTAPGQGCRARIKVPLDLHALAPQRIS